ncbi:MAG: hypothetical protein GF341_02505 [candidate division Zixibacteria bacterium]|nr:hypothetical protein [candidate division Zixibacteria bacterium]
MPESTDLFKHALKSQFHSSLAMLKQAIEDCPEDLWVSKEYLNPYWRIVYHTLYFTHLYIQPSVHEFTPWEHHQTSIQDMDDVPSPPDILELTELPHRPPQTGEPYTKLQMLEYWAVCDGMIDETVDRLELTAPESGFSWYRVSLFEHKLVALRHIHHHLGQLMDRVRNHADIGIRWVGATKR